MLISIYLKIKQRADALLRKILDSQVVYADTNNRRFGFSWEDRQAHNTAGETHNITITEDSQAQPLPNVRLHLM
jgi:hypothetical protein